MKVYKVRTELVHPQKGKTFFLELGVRIKGEGNDGEVMLRTGEIYPGKIEGLKPGEELVVKRPGEKPTTFGKVIWMTEVEIPDRLKKTEPSQMPPYSPIRQVRID